jgi:hypothetical protein
MSDAGKRPWPRPLMARTALVLSGLNDHLVGYLRADVG